ncbi:MAG TPA: hypothetical protein PK014_13725 [Thermoanaerobaculia bacterium]|nr:hypothetical protein [Thermoanaerobaculia bacterium]HUM31099.1 hypothetical protein [Thermoanaerobaculia bacterium]HXK69455.1 hypothetical protein [Thermoanaerobaculia bacterium]
MLRWNNWVDTEWLMEVCQGKRIQDVGIQVEHPERIHLFLSIEGGSTIILTIEGMVGVSHAITELIK